MSLTTAADIQLRNAEFTKAFEGERDLWLEMAKEAYDYTSSTVTGDPKRDDVAPHLALALEARDEFLLIKAQKKAQARYWFRHFADLIVDRTWQELSEQ